MSNEPRSDQPSRKKGRKGAKAPTEVDSVLAEEPLGETEEPLQSAGPSIVVEGVDIDQPEHVNSMRKYAVALKHIVQDRTLSSFFGAL